MLTRLLTCYSFSFDLHCHKMTFASHTHEKRDYAINKIGMHIFCSNKMKTNAQQLRSEVW